MKKFTKQEILELYGQVTLDEISFSQMVEIMNKMVSDADKPCIEDIPKRKFNVGDKVVLKSGLAESIYFGRYVGRKITVEGYTNSGYVYSNDCIYCFPEEYLEPYEGLKKGDLAIFWDEAKKCAIIRIYDQLDESEDYLQNKDNTGIFWDNAIKFESKEQYERLIKGEI